MTYLALSFGLVGLAAVLAWLLRKHQDWKVTGLTTLVMVTLTAIFDNMIIGFGIVAYDPSKISGVMVGLAPIEDFSYAIAVALVLPALWNLMRTRL